MLLGLDDLAAAKGIINHIDSVVTFRDDAGVGRQYPFEPVGPQTPVLPASVSGMAAAKSGGSSVAPQRKVQHVRCGTDGDGVELGAVLAVDRSGANKPGDNAHWIFPVGVGPPKNDAVTFDTVAANATRACLDLGMPSPITDWSPDLPPQSTVGRFTSWFKTDMWPADSAPALPVATMATSSISSSGRLECSTTEFGSTVKLTLVGG